MSAEAKNKQEAGSEEDQVNPIENIKDGKEDGLLPNDQKTGDAEEIQEEPSASTSIRDMKGGMINTGQTINQYFRLDEKGLKNILPSSELGSIARFSKKQVRTLSDREVFEMTSMEKYLATDQAYEFCKNTLLEYNILILYGNTKGSLDKIACQVGTALKQDEKINEIGIIDSLNKQIRFEIEKDLLSESGNFGEHLIIFKNPLRLGNPDIEYFLSDLPSVINNVSPKLQNQNTFLVFIFDATHHLSMLKNSGYSIDIAPPELERKKAALDELLTDLRKETAISPEQHQILDKLLTQITSDDNSNRQFFGSLIYISEVEGFVQQLKQILKNDNSLVPDETLLQELARNASNLKLWLIHENGKNLQRWSFIIALSFLSASSNLVSTFNQSLFSLNHIWERLKKHFEEIFNLKKEKSDWSAPMADTDFLSLVHAYKVNDSATNRVDIQFKSADLSEEVWHLMIREMTFTLLKAVPFLEQMINEGKELEHMACCLGRIGELDPSQTIHRIIEWASDNTSDDILLIGYLFHGVYASKNNKYIDRCEKLLEDIGVNWSDSATWSSIFAYRQIGLHKLEYAIDQLGIIVEKKLVPGYKKTSVLESNQNWNFNKLNVFTAITLDEFGEIFNTEHQLQQEAEKMASYSTTLQMLVYTITGLCQFLSPVTVFEQWQKWLDVDEKLMKVLFLRVLILPGGVLDNLNKLTSEYNDNQESQEEWHYLVLQLSYGEKETQFLNQFINRIFKTIKEVKAEEAQAMSNLLCDYFRSWAESSLNNKEAQTIICEFLGALLDEIDRLNKAFVRILKIWENEKELKYKTLATKILNSKNQHREKRKQMVSFDVGRLKKL